MIWLPILLGMVHATGTTGLIQKDSTSGLSDALHGKSAFLLACPSRFPSKTASTYSDCNFTGLEVKAFNVTTGTSLVLQNCTFSDCFATEEGGCIYATIPLYVYSCYFEDCTVIGMTADEVGGAIYSYLGLFVCEDTTFYRCRARSAGAIHLGGNTNAINNCNFTTCWGDGFSGAISISSTRSTVITKSLFVRCTADASVMDGGGAIGISGQTNITDCLFESCRSWTYGGALGLRPCMVEVNTVVFICNTEIARCVAEDGAGGAIYVNAYFPDEYTISLTISSSLLVGCSASNSSAGQVIHIVKCHYFAWDDLCITGSGTLVMTDDSSIAIPTDHELIEMCPSATPTPSPAPTCRFTAVVPYYKARKSGMYVVSVFCMLS